MKKIIALISFFLSAQIVFANPTLTHFGNGKARLKTSGIFLTEAETLGLRPPLEALVTERAMAMVQAEQHGTQVARETSLRLHIRNLVDPLLEEQLSAYKQNFWCFRVLGGGDCGFFALETTREEIMAAVKADLENNEKRDAVLALLQFEAASYFLDGEDFDLGLQIRNNGLTREVAERFLNARYNKPKGDEFSGYQYYLDAVPQEGGAGLIDYIARHKGLNINVWKWKQGQKPTHGVRLVKRIRIEGAVRTVDIVEGDRHFSRLVNMDQTITDFETNRDKALETEKLWQAVTSGQQHPAVQQDAQRDDGLALALQLSLETANGSFASSSSSATKKNEGDKRFPGTGQRLGGGAEAASSTVPTDADEAAIAVALASQGDDDDDVDDKSKLESALRKYVEDVTQSKKWGTAQTLNPDHLKVMGIPTESAKFSPTSNSDVCISRVALPKSSGNVTYSVGFQAVLGGRFTYVIARDSEMRPIALNLNNKAAQNGTYLHSGTAESAQFGLTVTVPAGRQAFIFVVSPWSGGRGNTIIEEPHITRIS